MREIERGRKAKPRIAKGSPRNEPAAALAQEITAYAASRSRLLRKHRGQFVLIKGDEVAGIFPDRSVALEAGYKRYGIVPFLVREITESDPIIHLPNIVP